MLVVPASAGIATANNLTFFGGLPREQWLPDFALAEREKESLGIGNVARLLSRAAQVSYNTQAASTTTRDKRGEIGEILLHACLRNLLGTLENLKRC